MSNTVSPSYDVVMVGGGIAGSGLATVLGRAGLRCLVLEATDEFPDRTKGEWIAPWGVLDARRTGLEDVLRSARGHTITRHISYDETRTRQESEQAMLPLDALMPGLPGPLTQRHPDACEALFTAAGEAGATTLRPVRDVSVEPGTSPYVHFVFGDVRHSVRCRLVVGADGRNSGVRKALGMALHKDEPHHLFSGLLVDGAHGWPAELQVTGTEDDVHYLAFPQGQGRVRLYLGWELADRNRLSGPQGPERFVERFGRLGTLPGADILGSATPVSPCATYPNEDAWVDSPVAPGVVLVGDAAGWNDPITGQGLSITMRDIRMVSEAMLGASDWTTATFQPYADERSERMRRLRFSAHLTAVLQNEFGAAACERRVRARARIAAAPELAMSTAIVMIGPELAPPDAFTEDRFQLITA